MQDALTRIIGEVHERYADVDDGALADYIPELTQADPGHFGMVVVTADGRTYAVGDTDVSFTIQSVSKAFAYVLALDLHGPAAVEEVVDVEPSGEAFNSISLDPDTGRPRNPMINAGAIAVTGMLPDGEVPRSSWILDRLSAFAGRALDLDEAVYASEARTGHRNRAIANLLRGVDLIGDPVDGVVEDYFRQCSILVTARDLARMAAVLANGGVHPDSGSRLVGADSVDRALSVMSTCGMYDYSGTWMYDVGVPAKSGVGGGVVGVLPGQLAVAAYSPLLDAKGNSVRGVAAIRDLSRALDLHLLRGSTTTATAIRRTYRLSDVAMGRRRPDRHRSLLSDLGHRTLVVEFQGDCSAAPLERLVRAVRDGASGFDMVVVDLTRAGTTDGATATLLDGIGRDVATAGKRLLVADPHGVVPAGTFDHRSAVLVVDTLDDALLICEEALLHAVDALEDVRAPVDLADFELLRDLGEHALERLRPRFASAEYPDGEVIVAEGAPTDALFLLAEGRARVEVDPDGHGSTVRVADMYPGTVFGEQGLLEQAPRSATVRALGACRAWVLSRDQLMELRRVDHLTYTRLVEHLVVALSRRLRETTREAASLRD